uniref:Ig-like domain-containing protein n=1 Tax=Amphimedon queenslandica TaxID=400682 RepID=A0A1X7SWE0_AMPQE
MSCRFHSDQAPVGVRSLLMVFLLLINADWFCQAQCPPDVVSVFILNDRTIHVPLTEPLCLQCRFLDKQGNFFTFSDGVWRKGSTVLNDGDFNGNVNLSSTSDTMRMTLEYPDDLVNVDDTITCSSSSTGQQNIITFGDFVFLNPTVSPDGSVDVTEGSNLTLTCSDPGNTGMPRYVWINDSDGSELTPVINNPPLSLSIIDIDRAASGSYTCRLTHIVLPGINRETTVTINVQPLSIPLVDIYIYQSTGSVIINCTYETYDSSIDVKWERNDSLLDPNSDPYITVITQSSYSELTISSLTQQYIGGYQCIVTNGAGSIKSGKVNVTIDPSVSSSTGSISNTLQATSSSSVIQPSSTIQRSSSITISPSNTQAVSSQNDRTVVYAVSGLIVGAVLIILVVVITATGCYFYRQYKATDKYDVNGEATSFTLEEFNDGPEK